jgi:hypothetical protein
VALRSGGVLLVCGSINWRLELVLPHNHTVGTSKARFRFMAVEARGRCRRRVWTTREHRDGVWGHERRGAGEMREQESQERELRAVH